MIYRGRMSVLRRLIPAIVLAALLGGAAAIGLVGSPNRPERFDAKTIVYAPSADGALRVTETVDIDFGTAQRRGYERVLRTDLGVPTDITAESATMSNRLNLFEDPGVLTIRIGDPDVTASGRHRFVLGYTLPGASPEGAFDLSVIDPGEVFETGRFTVVLDGFRLDDPLCSVGDWGEVGGCALTVDDHGRQTVTFEPLPAGDGVNLSGMAFVTGPTAGVDTGDPFPPLSSPATWWRALLIIAAALAVGLWVTRWSIARGMNDVGALDAAGAALGATGTTAGRVTDDELAAMATVEFSPPADIAPWEGKVLIDEEAPDSIAGVWVSSLLGSGALTATEVDDDVVLGPGPGSTSVSDRDASLVVALLPGGGPRRIGRTHDPAFAAVWTSIADDLRDRATARNWWTRPVGSGTGRRGSVVVSMVLGVTIPLVLGLIGLATRVAGGAAGVVTGNIVAGVVVAALGAALVAFVRTVGDRASRTVAGSAAYLRVASFRRFLAASEGRHVEEAHRRGVLREYTAWAVALGEADAWERAAATLGSAAVLTTVTTAAFMHHHTDMFSSATTAPSSSGGGGGGGAGGGGGGGSSGSW